MKVRTPRTEVRTSFQHASKVAVFCHWARWRSGYAEDCKSTATRPGSSLVRTIHAPFNHGVLRACAQTANSTDIYLAPPGGNRTRPTTRALEARMAVHFVGFRGDEYHRARRVFGDPDFIHIGWDRRARREIADGDLILFARGPHDQAPSERNFDDIREAPLSTPEGEG